MTGPDETFDEYAAKVCSDRFRSELHNLFWIEPLKNRGTLDRGWNCREHALVLGTLTALRGWTSHVVHGQAYYVLGPTAQEPPVGLEVGPHSWLVIDGRGSCDLSPHLAHMPGTRAWPEYKESYLFGGRFSPPKSTMFMSTGSLEHWQASYNQATLTEDGRFAGYLRMRIEPFSSELVTQARNWCDSPLTVRLRKRFPTRSDIYARAILHLDAFLEDKAESLTSLPQLAAWRQMAHGPGNATHKLLERL